MKSMRLQKSQFLKSLVNWEKLGSATKAYIQKIQFSIFFMNREKLSSRAKSAFKNSKISLLIEKNLEMQPKCNTQRILIWNLWIN